MNFERGESKSRAVSLIAMINVVFLLLIFFLVAGTVQKFDIIPIEVPVAESGRKLDEGQVVIVLGRYEEVLIEDELVAMESFVPTLSAYLADNPGKIISLKADSRLPASRLLMVMDKIKEAGGRNLSLVTRKL